jgi:hypothetical protein
MGLPGRKPKRADQVRHTGRPVHEYRTFADVPNPKPRPLPPARELAMATGLKRWPAATSRWWKAVSALPHTVAWTDADWEYAYETAILHALFSTGSTNATSAGELRRRNHEVGATWQGRRDLRVLYVNDDGQELRENKDPAVTAMDDYRKAVE